MYIIYKPNNDVSTHTSFQYILLHFDAYIT